MAETRAPRRLQDPAVAAYLRLLAGQIKEERKPTAQQTIAEEMGLDPAQFTNALHGRTSSNDVLRAFAKYRHTNSDDLRERAHAWYAANRLDEVASEVWSRLESPDELEELCRRLRALARSTAGAEPRSDSTPTGSDDA